MEGRKEDSHREEGERRDEPAKECIEKENEAARSSENVEMEWSKEKQQEGEWSSENVEMKQREAARTSKEKNENNG